MDMFNRLKGAIDSRIAEEQARQRSLQGTQARSGPAARRQAGRSASPAVKTPRTPPIDGLGDPLAKGPDPKEFEPEFVIADDDEASTRASTRATTPLPNQNKELGNGVPEKSTEKPSVADNGPPIENEGQDSGNAVVELPMDVKAKLRKLERLEPRYQELLRSYRIAHARVSAIEIFEAALRENTPLTSINDPKAFTDYLNQLNLKNDMVLDELKRVSTENQSLKKKLQESEEKHGEALGKIEKLNAKKTPTVNTEATEQGVESKPMVEGTQKDSPASRQASMEEQRDEQSLKSPTSPTKSRTPSIAGFSIFSPKSKPVDVEPVKEQGEEFFSYDSELPRLESELQERQNQVESLQSEVKTLKSDLAVARESTQSMVQTLEESTRDLNSLRERNDRCETEIKSLKAENDSSLSDLHSQLETADRKIRELEAKGKSMGTERELAEQKELVTRANDELENLRKLSERNSKAFETVSQLEAHIKILEKEISELKEGQAQSTRHSEELNNSIFKLRQELSEAQDEKSQVQAKLASKSKALQELQDRLAKLEQEQENRISRVQSEAVDSTPLPTPAQTPTVESAAGKKNKKKKKKGGKAASTQDTESVDQTASTTAPLTTDSEVSKLQEEVKKLTGAVEEKNAAIERLSSKLKDEEGLREEIESLRDDLINVGQDHVTAKDKIKEMQAEKSSLENTISELEQELAKLRTFHAEESSGSAQAHKDLTGQFNELKSKATSLETDLAVAQQLASSRFKDLTELRTALQKAQPELSSLRKENTELKSVQNSLNKKMEELQKVEARHNTVRTELADLRRRMGEKESEVKALTQRVGQETSGRQTAEEAQVKAKQDVQRLESEKREINDALARSSNNLLRIKEELANAKAKIREAEDTFSKLQSEADRLKEEIELKTAQYISAESLMNSMRDQTSEMATQTKESRERCESLEEEVADAHRLLSERSREAETMRRMLSEIEGRSDSKVREMKERLDSALEERDKAEDDASTAGRRRARELEDLRTKLREAQRDLRRAEEEKEELVVAQRDWKKRREDLEHKSEATSMEADEVRKAMSALRDALDDSEQQVRDLEKQRLDLRRTVEDTTQRLERLQKSNKILAEEVKATQAKAKAQEQQAQSARSSIDSTAARSRMTSPPAKGTSTPTSTDGTNGLTISNPEYLKNILLQFLEKDKNMQMQLVPVLGMMLHFNKQDEQNLMTAITTR